ncbi:MAG: AMP-binding protein, partial [Deinococcus sp.]
MTTPTTPPLLSTMMDVPLTVAGILERVRTLYAGREVVSLLAVPDEQGRPSPLLHRTSYGEVARRALQLAAALRTVGVGPGDRVATLAVNSYRHLEAYLGVPSMGAVLHTVNIRLHPDQVAWILGHAEDKVLLIEHLFAPLIPALRAACPGLETVVMLGTPATGLPDGVLDYDDWISGFSGEPDYPVLDERQAAAMCYTSGTTGNPKGVLYSHRSTVLHSLAAAPKDALNVGERDVVLPVVPMFHVNAWGLPYTCAVTGAAQVFAGPFSDGPSLARLLEAERVSITAGVPTIWMGLLQELDRAQAEGKPYDLSCLESLVVGGSAAPEALLRAYRERHGLTLRHAWGMTETHPLGTVSVLPRGMDPGSDEGYRLPAKQGRTVPLVELKLLGDAEADGSGGEPLPHDGRTMGRLLARGPWVTASYFKGEGSGNFVDIGGETWFDTGDIAT